MKLLREGRLKVIAGKLGNVCCWEPPKYFGHIARANPSMDHSRALRASVAPLPRDWNRRAGRPRHTWLRTVESDLAPFNIGLATAYHRAQNR